MSIPLIETVPFVGLSRPLKCLTRVVLPEPFWPKIATTSPSLTLRFIPFIAVKPSGYTCDKLIHSMILLMLRPCPASTSLKKWHQLHRVLLEDFRNDSLFFQAQTQ